MFLLVALRYNKFVLFVGRKYPGEPTWKAVFRLLVYLPTEN